MPRSKALLEGNMRNGAASQCNRCRYFSVPTKYTHEGRQSPQIMRRTVIAFDIGMGKPDFGSSSG